MKVLQEVRFQSLVREFGVFKTDNDLPDQSVVCRSAPCHGPELVRDRNTHCTKHSVYQCTNWGLASQHSIYHYFWEMMTRSISLAAHWLGSVNYYYSVTSWSALSDGSFLAFANWQNVAPTYNKISTGTNLSTLYRLLPMFRHHCVPVVDTRFQNKYVIRLQRHVRASCQLTPLRRLLFCQWRSRRSRSNWPWCLRVLQTWNQWYQRPTRMTGV